MPWPLSVDATLPSDADRALLVGRVWLPGAGGGPSVVVVSPREVRDITAACPTMADLLAADDPAALARNAGGPVVDTTDGLIANSWEPDRDPARASLLAPADLQPIKACGVTFVASLVERLVEERAGGNPADAGALRRALETDLGPLDQIRPASPEAARLKMLLGARGLWSQYLEVGFGPDAEVFTKASPMSAVGAGARVGVRRSSAWSNPEPELVLAVSPAGRIAGVTLGNDVNLRDYEGRSALLLGQAKDNNASCAVGPWIRLVDEHFTLDDVRALDLAVSIRGQDGFSLEQTGHLRAISRDVTALVAQAVGPHHQYPDGLLLFTGTMFAPTADRIEPGAGFTHRPGDVVAVSAPRIGALVNAVTYCDEAPPWTFGLGALLRNLAARGLLAR
jgi:fumarylacetoacetate (FAA) hydrolase family protein